MVAWCGVSSLKAHVHITTISVLFLFLSQLNARRMQGCRLLHVMAGRMQEAERLAKWASYEAREKEKQAARESKLSQQLSAKEERLARKAADKAARAAQLTESRKCVFNRGAFSDSDAFDRSLLSGVTYGTRSRS